MDQNWNFWSPWRGLMLHLLRPAGANYDFKVEASSIDARMLIGTMEASLSSLIDKTWVTLEFCNHGYDHVVNIATDVILAPDEPGYDYKKFSALLEEIKPYLRRYDRTNVVGKEMSMDLRRG